MTSRAVGDPALDGRVAGTLAALAADPDLTGASGSTLDRVLDALLRRHREYTRKPAALFRKAVAAAMERVRARQAPTPLADAGGYAVLL